MLKLYFENAENLINGINEIADEFRFEVSSYETDSVKVTISESDEAMLEVKLKDNEATIVYGGGTPKFSEL